MNRVINQTQLGFIEYDEGLRSSSGGRKGCGKRYCRSAKGLQIWRCPLTIND
jgi:hypothetical protein